jgi:hypothetical protein
MANKASTSSKRPQPERAENDRSTSRRKPARPIDKSPDKTEPTEQGVDLDPKRRID